MTKPFRRLLFTLLLVLLVPALAPTDARAQTTFRACRVANVGAIYMIGVTGTPSSCLDPSHTEFSWTEGGTPAAGSITAEHLAAGAVTAVKIASNAVAATHIGAGAVGSSEVADNSLTKADLAAGSVGASELGLQVVSSNPQLTDGTGGALGTPHCPAGKVAIAAGIEALAGVDGYDITGPYPTANPVHWAYQFVNISGEHQFPTIYTVCVGG